MFAQFLHIFDEFFAENRIFSSYHASFYVFLQCQLRKTSPNSRKMTVKKAQQRDKKGPNMLQK